MTNPGAVNEERLNELLGKMLGELGAAATASLVLVGDRLGLYRALAAHGPQTSEELARSTGTRERNIREWLANQAASGYVEYDAGSGRFSMTPEQAAVFADPDSPASMIGGFYGIGAMMHDEEKLAATFHDGGGFAWGDHNACLFCGTEKFFRPAYKAHLLADWIPALEGVVEKLERGARIADVGCGHGVSTVLLAQAFPASRFMGFDYHAPSIERARQVARDAGVKNVQFEVATAKGYPGSDYDMVAFFDCLHDMGDPAGAAAHVRETLKPDGTWLVVEPMAGDSLSENMNPIGRLYYAFSTAVCTPSSLSQEVGVALGAQAGPKRLEAVIREGGFTRFRRATETPFNLILEARP